MEHMQHDAPIHGMQSSLFDKDTLDQLLSVTVHTSEQIVDFFKQRYPSEYAADSGVWEGYTIEQHTLMAMHQYDTYFAQQPVPCGITPNFFKIILALHDIGKPHAIKAGTKDTHHHISSKMAAETLQELGFSQQEITVASALISSDHIGQYIQHGDGQHHATEIANLAHEKGLNPTELFDAMILYYKVDAGSYTTDAGGLPSLDYLFVFDQQHKSMDFSPETKSNIDALRTLIH